MKKLIILSFFTVVSTVSSFAQWVTKKVDNKLDPPYRIAYCSDVLDRVFLKLEKVDEQLAFYIGGGYFCDDEINVDIAFVINGESKLYNVLGIKNSNSSVLFLVDDLLSEEQKDFLKDFKSCESAVIRINESHCTSDIYKFNMTGSTKSVSFLLQESR